MKFRKKFILSVLMLFVISMLYSQSIIINDIQHKKTLKKLIKIWRNELLHDDIDSYQNHVYASNYDIILRKYYDLLLLNPLIEVKNRKLITRIFLKNIDKIRYNNSMDVFVGESNVYYHRSEINMINKNYSEALKNMNKSYNELEKHFKYDKKNKVWNNFHYRWGKMELLKKRFEIIIIESILKKEKKSITILKLLKEMKDIFLL